MSATQFDYKVRDPEGRFREGRVKADTEAAVAEKLMAMGYVPLEVKPAGVGLQKEISFGRKRVKLKDLSIFARQLATMIDAGLTLMRALSILAEQLENPSLQEVIAKVKQDVEGGHSLSSAFANDTYKTFPPFMISMTRAGEAGGFLDTAMLQVAETFEAEVRLRGKIKAAMTYPVVVFVMAILMVTGMLLFVVPIFEQMFIDLGGDLPLPTQVLVTLSGAMKFVAPVGGGVRHRIRVLVAPAQERRGRPQHRGPAAAQAAGVRTAVAQDRALPVLPQPQHAAALGRPDPRLARDRRPTPPARSSSRAHSRRCGSRWPRATRSPGRSASTTCSRRWSCR